MSLKFTLRHAVEFAAKTEELGTVFYKRLADMFEQDRDLYEIFSTLAEDEVAHQEQFAQLLAAVPKEDDGLDDDARIEFLEAIARSAFFIGETGLFKQLSQIKTREDALEKALRLEKETWRYYLAMQEVLGPNEVLQSIIDAERGHVAKIAQYLLTGAKMRGLGDQYAGGHHGG